MRPLTFALHAAGVLAPGLASLAQLRLACRGVAPIDPVPLVLAAPPALPPAERRRASQAVRLTLACIAQALEGTSFDPAQLRSVFATDEGTGEVCQQMLEALATTGQLSPLLFANSVHNAPSGYFSIAWRNQQPATVVSAGLDSFACGLLCAVTDATVTGQPVLLAAYDPAMAAPMDELLPVAHSTAVAWVLTAGDASAPAPVPVLGRFELLLRSPTQVAPSPMPAWLPPVWHANSSARALIALALLEGAPGGVAHFGLGGQVLTLRRMEVT